MSSKIALVIGTRGQDLDAESALDHVLGVTVMTTSAPGRRGAVEMIAEGSVPAKGKDFATSLRPWITTLDEFDVRTTPRCSPGEQKDRSRDSTAF